MAVLIRRVGMVDGRYVAPTQHFPADGPSWANQGRGVQSAAAKRGPKLTQKQADADVPEDDEGDQPFSDGRSMDRHEDFSE